MRYAAFLRAINVGRHNRIRMVDLKAVCTAAGLANVSTYLQTGNLLFEFDRDPEEAASTLERALIAHGLRGAAAVVRTSQQLNELLGAKPFARYPAESHTRFVTLFGNELSPELQAIAREASNVVLVRDREICTALPIPRPTTLDVNGSLQRQVNAQGTTRYWHVVEEVARLLG